MMQAAAGHSRSLLAAARLLGGAGVHLLRPAFCGGPCGGDEPLAARGVLDGFRHEHNAYPALVLLSLVRWRAPTADVRLLNEIADGSQAGGAFFGGSWIAEAGGGALLRTLVGLQERWPRALSALNLAWSGDNAARCNPTKGGGSGPFVNLPDPVHGLRRAVRRPGCSPGDTVFQLVVARRKRLLEAIELEGREARVREEGKDRVRSNDLSPSSTPRIPREDQSLAGESARGGGGIRRGMVCRDDRAAAEQPGCLEVHIVYQYYRHTRAGVGASPLAARRRQREIDEALLRNLENPFVHSVHVLLEAGAPPDAPSFVADAVRSTGRNKVLLSEAKGRLTFGDALRYADASVRGPDRAVVIMNADIIFDESLARLADIPRMHRPQTALALLHWEYAAAEGEAKDANQRGRNEVLPFQEREVSLWPRTDSQDAWVVFPPLPTRLLEGLEGPQDAEDRWTHKDYRFYASEEEAENEGGGCAGGRGDFEVGMLRADGVLARRFACAGMQVLNPALEIIAGHNHRRQEEAAETDPENGGWIKGYIGELRRSAEGVTDTVFLSFLR
jgi:hypothetical protein